MYANSKYTILDKSYKKNMYLKKSVINLPCGLAIFMIDEYHWSGANIISHECCDGGWIFVVRGVFFSPWSTYLVILDCQQGLGWPVGCCEGLIL